MNEEGNATIESSLVFPLTIFFVVMIISISIFAYKNVTAKLKFSNDVQTKTETLDDIEVEDELIYENKMLFQNTWNALTDKALEIKEMIKKKIRHVSIIGTINDSDYALEKAEEILKGESIWMKTELSLLI